MSQYLDIAKETAKIILEDSYERNKVKGVMLYGSTLKSETPSDIDLLIIHENDKWESYSGYHHRIPDNRPGKDNVKDHSWDILSKLRFGGDKGVGNRPVVKIAKLLRNYKLPIIEKDIKNARKILARFLPKGVESVMLEDLLTVNRLFDINILNKKLLKPTDDEDLKKSVQQAINACDDKRFWNKILGYGKLYDTSTHEFSIPLTDRYPEAPELFEYWHDKKV